MKTKKQIKEGAYSPTYKKAYEDARKDFEGLLDKTIASFTDRADFEVHVLKELKTKLNK